MKRGKEGIKRVMKREIRIKAQDEGKGKEKETQLKPID